MVLALTPEECERLTLAQQIGSIALVLRSLWGDKVDTTPAPVTTEMILGSQ